MWHRVDCSLQSTMTRRFKPWTFMAFALASAILLQVLPSATSTKMPPNDGPGPQVVDDINRSPPPWHLLEQEPSHSCNPTPLYVDPEAYKERCKPFKGPCFGHFGASLKGTQVSPWLEPLNMTDEVVLADDSAQCKPNFLCFIRSRKILTLNL